MEGVMQETITAEERTELEKERFALAIERIGQILERMAVFIRLR